MLREEGTRRTEVLRIAETFSARPREGLVRLTFEEKTRLARGWWNGWVR